jgi:type II secretory pathway pseudopilin PulG
VNYHLEESTFHTSPKVLSPSRKPERGYTLVALMGLMTILAMFAMAAAPNLRQQAQREREKDAIFRGEQVADAIRLYYKNRARQSGQGIAGLPTSMEQLIEGISIPQRTKKLQILRASAAQDPLSQDREWRLVAPNSQQLIDFERSLVIYAGNNLPATTDPDLRAQQQAFAPFVANVLNTGSTETSSGGEDSFGSSSGPFIGVASRSRRSSVITYYGIDRHDQWIFTPLFR